MLAFLSLTAIIHLEQNRIGKNGGHETLVALGITMETEGAQPFPLPSPPIGLPSALHQLLGPHSMRALFFGVSFHCLDLGQGILT